MHARRFRARYCEEKHRKWTIYDQTRFSHVRSARALLRVDARVAPTGFGSDAGGAVALSIVGHRERHLARNPGFVLRRVELAIGSRVHGPLEKRECRALFLVLFLVGGQHGPAVSTEEETGGHHGHREDRGGRDAGEY